MSIQIQLTDENSDIYCIGNGIFVERNRHTELWRALALRSGWIQAISEWRSDPRELLAEINEKGRSDI